MYDLGDSQIIVLFPEGMIARDVKKTLWRLIGAVLASAGLFAFFIFDRDSPFAGLAVGLVVVVVFPSTLLFAIDASRAIRREILTNNSVRVLGRILGIPQAIFGIILMAFGVAYPVYKFINGLGPTPFVTALYIVMALVMFCVGFYYVREGLWLIGVGRVRNKKS
jgi:hypothetical protein